MVNWAARVVERKKHKHKHKCPSCGFVGWFNPDDDDDPPAVPPAAAPSTATPGSG